VISTFEEGLAMTTPANHEENTYVMDAESVAEMGRLMRQDHLLTQAMGGLFPERVDASGKENLTGINRVLDIACGPGGWALEVGFQYPHIQTMGIDISQTMIVYAREQVRVRGLDNVNFRVMNALKPLEFPEGSFDLVNARTIVSFMPPTAWPGLLAECMRLLRPGGVLRINDMEWGFSNKRAFEKYSSLFNHALSNANQSFSPNGIHVGILPMLPHLLKQANCQDVRMQAYVVDFSYGTNAHYGCYQDYLVGFKLLQPFILKWIPEMTGQELEQLYQEALVEMQTQDFNALWFLLSVWGSKPE
jgi:ubiquinone/menaquinone biosynthesis C-methylase UbiE